MTHNPALKLAIFTKRLKQIDVAEKAGMSEPTLSKIINGRRSATPEEQANIAKALRMPVDSLFTHEADA